MSQLLQRPGKFALTIGLLVTLLGGCTTTQAVDRSTTYTTSNQASFSEAQLDSLLAPIALYPDTVLSHVLIASTYPLEVVEADRWARNNTRYKGDEAVNAVDSRDWDPSVKALVAFPDILRRMSEDLDWTRQLGDAFLADEERVMDSVQRLRNRAYDSGSLDKVEHVRVIREEKTIVIEPSVERVVYVPAYDTRVVYGNWWWPDYPPVYWVYPSSYVFVSGFYWGPRVHIGPRFYFSGCHWHERRVYVVDRHHHNHRFYDSRSVVRHVNASHWKHNPVHRRGVAYYDNRTRERFNSPRESFRDTKAYRADLRGNSPGQLRSDPRPDRKSPHIAPNQAREVRQDRAAEFQQRLERRQAGQISIPNRTPGAERTPPRSDQVRDRLNNRTEHTPDAGDTRRESPRTITGQARPTTETRSTRQLNTNPGTERQSNGDRPPRVERQSNVERVERIETPRNPRSDVQRQETPRYERPQPQRIERSETIQRVERNDRPQRFEQSGGQRTEGSRDSTPRESRSFDRGESRGVRER